MGIIIRIVLTVILAVGAVFIDRSHPLFYVYSPLVVLFALTNARKIYLERIGKLTAKINISTMAAIFRESHISRNLYFRQAYDLLLNGREKESKRLLEDAMSFDPKDPDPLVLYGTILMWETTRPYHYYEKLNQQTLNNKLKTISKYFKKALEIRPDHLMGHFYYGILLSESLDFSSSFQHFQVLLDKYPDQEFRNHEIKDGLELLKKEKNKFGLSSLLALSLGETYASLGKFMLAQTFLKTAIKKHPGCLYLAHQRYVRVVIIRGEFQKAFKSSIILFIRYSGARYFKNWTRALSMFNWINLMYLLGTISLIVFRKFGYDSSIIRKLPSKIARFYLDPYIATSQNMIETINYPEALGACRKGLVIDPSDETLITRSTMLYSWLDDNNSAIICARRLCLYYPKEHTSWNGLAVFLVATNRKKEAIECSKQALNLLPANTDKGIRKMFSEYAKGDFSSIKLPLTVMEYDPNKNAYWVFEKGKKPYLVKNELAKR